jgi:hypothetical protein
MASRSWFFATDGQQHGPYSEDQFRDLIAKGGIRPDTYVWSEGMAAWQFAGDVPGLLSGGARPPAFPVSGAPMAHGAGIGALSLEAGTWAVFGRSLLLPIGNALVIPAPWIATSVYRWFVSHLHVPHRQNLAFTGQPGDIWYAFVLSGLSGYVGFSGIPYIQYIVIPIQAYLSWMMVRWFIEHISSEGQRLPLTFTGKPLAYVGWYVFGIVSIISIVGWAWVMTAWMRWLCQNVSGTRRRIVFEASGWQVLGNTILFVVGMIPIVTIPWVLRWYVRWFVSRFELVERTA